MTAFTPSLNQGLALLDLISDALLIRDLDGRIVFWNQEAVRRIGYAPDEAIGRVWHELLKTTSPRPLADMEAEVLARGAWVGELTHVDSQGREVRVSSRWTLLRDEAGQPAAVMQATDEVRRLTEALKNLSRVEAALRASENLFRSVFEHSPLGIARLDEGLRILNSNARLREMLGVPGDLVGVPAGRFLGAGDGSATQGGLREGTQMTGVTTGLQLAVKGDGSPIWLAWTSTPVFTPSGGLDYLLVMVEDVTAKHAAEETTLNNLAELERLNVLKSEFVGVVSHEFRTALTGIQGFSELIKDGNLGIQEMREFAADINKDALRLNRMITEMLDLERIEAGAITLNLGPLNLNELIEDCISRAKTMSEIHTIKTRLEADLPPIQGDADRLIQVVSNLLSNAIKYSPEGGVVEVATWLAPNQVVVSVADHGHGIPPEFIERVFERFERYEASPTSRIIGTGLGLPIARQIVEIHGGRMWVESQVGKGSIFNFALPLTGTPAG